MEGAGNLSWRKDISQVCCSGLLTSLTLFWARRLADVASRPYLDTWAFNCSLRALCLYPLLWVWEAAAFLCSSFDASQPPSPPACAVLVCALLTCSPLSACPPPSLCSPACPPTTLYTPQPALHLACALQPVLYQACTLPVCPSSLCSPACPPPSLYTPQTVLQSTPASPCSFSLWSSAAYVVLRLFSLSLCSPNLCCPSLCFPDCALSSCSAPCSLVLSSSSHSSHLCSLSLCIPQLVHLSLCSHFLLNPCSLEQPR